jgi:hypothetical protein
MVFVELRIEDGRQLAAEDATVMTVNTTENKVSVLTLFIFNYDLS